MAYVSEEEIRNARQVDLLSYLQANDPSELVHVSGQTYCTREHDSLKISNGKWYWFSRGFGGVSALDYLMKVKGLSLPQAMNAVSGRVAHSSPLSYRQAEPAPRKLILPEKNDTAEYVIRYLTGRGIHPAVIRYCLENLLLYESREYHNAVFVGYDERGLPRYAAIRGTIGSYKGEATGSDKHYSFRITEKNNSSDVHLFESAIDLMSYASLLQMTGRDWKQDALLSLAGVFQMRRKDVLPVALDRYLKQHSEVHTIHLHLDNDEVGRGAAEGIRKSLQERYTVLDEPPSSGKDVNDQLMMRMGMKTKKEEIVR
ncbi:MAG: DUF3991 and TOPRIM domain-containing protein [Erysipelotrichaceae bacterium]|nr:DUF3991 and TOPRIM domain-containing protein [Erysipelotrichaceae bacterium]